PRLRILGLERDGIAVELVGVSVAACNVLERRPVLQRLHRKRVVRVRTLRSGKRRLRELALRKPRRRERVDSSQCERDGTRGEQRPARRPHLAGTREQRARQEEEWAA